MDIAINNEIITYRLKRSSKARRLRLTVYPDASLVITLPYFISKNSVDRFIKEKASWIVEKVSYFKKKGLRTRLPGGKNEYLKNKIAAHYLVMQRLEYFNRFYGFKYARISIRDQKTRWGSCSRRGNLNFNYKIALISPEEADYIIVHELCHLEEFNHSGNFWNLVAKTIPEYKKIRKGIKNKSLF